MDATRVLVLASNNHNTSAEADALPPLNAVHPFKGIIARRGSARHQVNAPNSMDATRVLVLASNNHKC